MGVAVLLGPFGEPESFLGSGGAAGAGAGGGGRGARGGVLWRKERVV